MTVARYDAVADFYAGSFNDSDDPVLRALLDLLGPVDGAQVLDLACGHGRVARELVRLGATATSVDLSAALLEKAAAASPDVRFVHADAANARPPPAIRSTWSCAADGVGSGDY